jgi:hypothetical protein
LLDVDAFTEVPVPKVLVTGQTDVLLKIQVTTSLLVKEEELYVLAFVPTLAPFTFHWKLVFVPALVVVAVKVTGIPEQILLVDEVMATVAGADELTVMEILFELTVAGVAQAAPEVSVHCTTAPC